jgi:hypothetical protein
VNGARGAAHHWLRNATPLLDGVVVGAIPPFGHRREAALFAFRLEAEPAVNELGGDGSPRQGLSPAVDAAPSLNGIYSVFVLYPSLRVSTLGFAGMDLPHIPRFAVAILELAVSHFTSAVERKTAYLFRPNALRAEDASAHSRRPFSR